MLPIYDHNFLLQPYLFYAAINIVLEELFPQTILNQHVICYIIYFLSLMRSHIPIGLSKSKFKIIKNSYQHLNLTVYYKLYHNNK